MAIGAAGGLLGGGRPQASGGNAGMPPGTGVQHARPADRSIGDALAASDGEVSGACQALLPENDKKPPRGRHCGFRLVCLPRANTPARLYVCTETRAGPATVAD